MNLVLIVDVWFVSSQLMSLAEFGIGCDEIKNVSTIKARQMDADQTTGNLVPLALQVS